MSKLVKYLPPPIEFMKNNLKKNEKKYSWNLEIPNSIVFFARIVKTI